MQRKDLALRVLSTAAIMSIVTSIAAPAFAGTYYMANGNLSIRQDENGKVYVKSGDTDEKEDLDGEVVIRGGVGENQWSNAPSGGAATATGTEGSVAGEGASATGNAEDGSAPAAAAATGTEGSAAGESQPDPDDAFTLNETEEDSAQNQEGNNPTENPTEDTTDNHTEDTKDNPTEPPKKDVVYEYAPADPEPEQQATKLAPTTSADPEEKTLKTTQADTTTTPAAGSATTPTTNVIKVINNWVGEAAKKLKIRLSNVNIKSSTDAAMTVSGDGNTKIELDGKNTLDSSNVSGKAGLNKQGNGTMTITDEKTDGGETRTSKAADDKTGSLTVVGGVGAAGIGGNSAPSSDSGVGDTKNITIEGYATVDATSGKNGDTGICGGAGIGGGSFGSADNIIIQGNANVTAKTNNSYGAAIGSGAYGSGTNIGIYDHATVKATADMIGAAIGRGGYGQKASVTIGSKDKTQENENVHVTAKAYYSAIGGMAGFIGNAADRTTDIVIQGGATIEEASCTYVPAIGGSSGVSNVVIRGHAVIKKAGLIGGYGAYKFGDQGDKATVSIEDHARLENVSAIGGQNVEEANVTVKDNAYVGSVGAIGDDNPPDGKIGKLTAKILDNATIEKLSGWIGKRPNSTVDESEVTVDGGKNGKVTVKATDGNGSAYINANTVQIKNNVLLKLKQSTSVSEPNYIAANGVEMTRDKLMQTIGADAEIWYTDKDNTLQKIVHGKNVCKKEPGDLKKHQDATCGKDGYDEYQCGYETANGAANTSCDLTWQEVLKATGTHDYGPWTTVKDATCTTAGEKQRECSVCHQKETETIPALKHDYRDDWEETTPATCTKEGVKTRHCHNDPSHVETQPIPMDSNNHAGHGTYIVGKKDATCTTDGYTGDTYCDGCHHKIKDGTVIPATGHHWTDNGDNSTHICVKGDATEAHSYGEWTTVTPATCTAAGQKQHTCTVCGHVETQEIPATGHHWVDNGDGTHTCPDCGATEGQPFNTNSALELRVVDAEGMDQPFTVSQNGTLRTYTGAYDTATLTGDLDTLRYLQDHGAQTIQFVTNGQTSSFAINDLLAQGSGSEVFYLTHRGAEEPTLLLVEADHSDLVKD